MLETDTNNLWSVDLYNEIFEIIDSCTFSAKSISPTMWQAFEMIHKTFKAGAELYLEGMFKCLLSVRDRIVGCVLRDRGRVTVSRSTFVRFLRVKIRTA